MALSGLFTGSRFDLGCAQDSFRPPQNTRLRAGRNNPGSMPEAIALNEQEGFQLSRPPPRPRAPPQQATEPQGPELRMSIPVTQEGTLLKLKNLMQKQINELGSNGADPKATLTPGLVQFSEILATEGPFRVSSLLIMLKALGDLTERSGVSLRNFPELSNVILDISRMVEGELTGMGVEHLCELFRCYGRFGPEVVFLEGEGINMTEVCTVMCYRAEESVPHLEPHEVSKVLWGLAAVEFYACRDLLDSIVLRVTPKVNQGIFAPREMATIVWALGKLGFKQCKMLLRAVGRKAKRRMGELAPKDILRFVWGMSQLDFKGLSGVLSATEMEIGRRMDEFVIRDLINVTFAFSRLAFYPGQDYCNRVTVKVFKELGNLSGSDISKAMHAFAVLGFRSSRLALSAITHFQQNVYVYAPREICSLLWALAIMDQLEADLLISGIKRLIKINAALKSDMRAQIHQCITHVRIWRSESQLEGIPEEFVAACKQAWSNEQLKRPSADVVPSVLSVFQQLGYTAHRRSITEVGPFCVDYVESPEGEKTIVEVTIPVHCYANNRNKLLATREWYLNTVGATGWNVLRLKEEEWNQVPRESKQKHLRRKMGLPEV